MLIAALLGLMIIGGLAPAAAAQSPQGEDKNCWGVVSAQRARTGGLGEHSSQQENPRAGLGNLSRDLGFDHISGLGSFLAGVDGIDETECG
ncbi:MAG TPA: hypothetical protein VK875_11785 [Euzebyales bacterium]|nr:hypothetical protein [Euzebyales bacterium]